MSQRISLLIHDRSTDSAKKSKQINNFTRNTGGGNNHGCELETTSDFFEASFCLIFCCYDFCDRFRTSFHVVLNVDAVKLQIPVLQKTMSSTANDHSLCVPFTNAKRQWCIKISQFSYYILKYIGRLLLILTVYMAKLFLWFFKTKNILLWQIQKMSQRGNYCLYK